MRAAHALLLTLVAFAAADDPLKKPLEDARSTLIDGATGVLIEMLQFRGGIPSFTTSYSPTTDSCSSPVSVLLAEKLMDSLQLEFNQAIKAMSVNQSPENIPNGLRAIGSGFRDLMSFLEGGNGGLGLGWGVNFYCGSDTTPVFSWGTGMGGGGQSISSSGYGGGAGGSSSKGEWGGGAGCDGSGSCNGGPDSGSKNDWLSLAQDALSCHDLLVCVSGGGGGGFSLPSESLLRGDGDSCELGAGFGFSGKSSVSSSASNAAEASCSSGDDGGEYAGVAARLCAAQCQSKSNFNQCFCPCFKSAITGHGISWGNSIQCS